MLSVLLKGGSRGTKFCMQNLRFINNSAAVARVVKAMLFPSLGGQAAQYTCRATNTAATTASQNFQCVIVHRHAAQGQPKVPATRLSLQPPGATLPILRQPGLQTHWQRNSTAGPRSLPTVGWLAATGGSGNEHKSRTPISRHPESKLDTRDRADDAWIPRMACFAAFSRNCLRCFPGGGGSGQHGELTRS